MTYAEAHFPEFGRETADTHKARERYQTPSLKSTIEIVELFDRSVAHAHCRRLMPAAAIRRANCRAWFIVAVMTWLFVAGPAPAQAETQEVVFRVGENASIDWFVIDNPLVRGSLNVTNAPYSNTTPLNAAAVDLGRNRLIYDSNIGTVQGYAINLAGLQLVQNGVTRVTVTALGAWPGGGDNAGYRKSDGQVYFHPNNSVQLRRLNFDASGLISGFTDIGSFSGPNAISAGDIDFSIDGSIWVSGNNASGSPKLWKFDPTTLNALDTFNLNYFFNGITFNAAGDTLYGYKSATGNYGVIDTATGLFQTILDTDTTVFGVGGDLATATANITIVPESGLPGDYDNNSAVDAGDYIAWRKGNVPLYNEITTIGSTTPGDYSEWRTRFGNVMGSGSGAFRLPAAIPEPSSIALMLVLCATLPLFAMPRRAVVRSFLMNHTIHHRAILSVYLRLNDIPVPGLYGPSGDE